MASTNPAEQGEGVLRDILEELDRERTRRAELESEVRELKLRAPSPPPPPPTSTAEPSEPEATRSFVSQREWIALETERDGFRQLVDVLTADNDAIAAAASQEKTLPLHVVRLLEVMPYDPRAVSSAKANEEVYEWQVHRNGNWQGYIRQFPPFFRKLPVVQPAPGSTIEEAKSKRFFPESPPKQCVLTNASVTRIIKLDKGYSLPQDGGTWEWVSGWRIDKRVVSTEDDSVKQKVDCDDEGWSYAVEPQHFVTSPTELCWDNHGGEHNVPSRTYRRRRWTRQRALRSYPNASENALQYLRLLSENARLAVTTTKLSDQLVETKTKLTEVEDKIVSTKTEWDKEVNALKKELQIRDEMISNLMQGIPVNGDLSPRRRGLSENQMSIVAGLANSLVSSASSAATNAFRKTPDASAESLRKASDVSDETSSAPFSAPDGFDWLNLGRNKLFQGLRKQNDEKKDEQEQEVEVLDNETDEDDGIKDMNEEELPKTIESDDKEMTDGQYSAVEEATDVLSATKG